MYRGPVVRSARAFPTRCSCRQGETRSARNNNHNNKRPIIALLLLLFLFLFLLITRLSFCISTKLPYTASMLDAAAGLQDWSGATWKIYCCRVVVVVVVVVVI